MVAATAAGNARDRWLRTAPQAGGGDRSTGSRRPRAGSQARALPRGHRPDRTEDLARFTARPGRLATERPGSSRRSRHRGALLVHDRDRRVRAADGGDRTQPETVTAWQPRAF